MRRGLSRLPQQAGGWRRIVQRDRRIDYLQMHKVQVLMPVFRVVMSEQRRPSDTVTCSSTGSEPCAKLAACAMAVPAQQLPKSSAPA